MAIENPYALSGKTDLERLYRAEQEKCLPNKESNRRGENFEWKDGNCYQGGVQVRPFQLDQTLHFYHKERNEKCQPMCQQCRTENRRRKALVEMSRKYGEPEPSEARGEYPCPDYGCSKLFSYRTHMIGHLEVDHQIYLNKLTMEEFKTKEARDKSYAEDVVAASGSGKRKYP